MSRLPFDPRKATGPERPGDEKPARRARRTYSRITEAEHLTVSELANLIKSTLEQRIPSPLRVVGQISNLSVQNHWYFSLKDETAVVSCVAWASAAKKFGFVPKDGDEVLATGHVSHYPPQGRTQLYVSSLKPVGAGALQLRFEAMCEELRKLGYFEEARKKPLPAFPRRVAVITSATGAAIHDVISTAAQRCRAVSLLVVDVRVQGEGAAEEIAEAIGWVDSQRQQLGVDAVLVTRGGGSIEDLWAFNERIVADAAFSCGLPIVAAIGHESDTTVIELVSDVRAATPTQAAMRLVPSASELHKQVHHLADRMRFVTRRMVSESRQRLRAQDRQLGSAARHLAASSRSRLERLAADLARLQPQMLVSRRYERLAVLADRLHRTVRHRIEQRPRVDLLGQRLQGAIQRHLVHAREQLAALDRELTAVDPRRVLGRGYSLTTDTDGSLIRSVSEVRTGQLILTCLSDGSINSTVTGSTSRSEGRQEKRRKSSGRSRVDVDQMDLFDQAE
ncbi:MAG: exodeoxyribonuclease VII large subunit [Phycisphaerales bacterium]|nr:MAG: exodeoxyribonuclease VII large subunit [Phycisphaerales bacterium]